MNSVASNSDNFENKIKCKTPAQKLNNFKLPYNGVSFYPLNHTYQIEQKNRILS